MRVQRILKAMLFFSVGGVFSTLYWVSQMPDQPVEGEKTCVPVYYSGLECCQ